MSMRAAWIGLGANLGDAPVTLQMAESQIGRLPATYLVSASSFYATSPVDSFGPDYVNAVVKVETKLAPIELLRALQKIENEFGRVRPAGVHNAPRTLDLDLLLYDGVKLSSPELTIPHPRMTERLFVLVPLAEIDPQLVLEDGESVEAAVRRVRKEDSSQSIRKLS